MLPSHFPDCCDAAKAAAFAVEGLQPESAKPQYRDPRRRGSMMALRAGCIASLLSLSLIACQGAATDDSAHSDLVGAWGLVSWRVTSADGETSYPFGETPEGQIIYFCDGSDVSPAHVSRSRDR